ncbi:hypothetical protein FGO68_gene8527 [Halteria grandinella]|uniref:Uncharacterized protein n=1 Tax=Halteria grandinella TaxID=5974 RepID=A0A8J8NHI7_HALGN|nr:hypothetical protein FGO68_gene8527 [Halteria grandinella]
MPASLSLTSSSNSFPLQKTLNFSTPDMAIGWSLGQWASESTCFFNYATVSENEMLRESQGPGQWTRVRLKATSGPGSLQSSAII